MIKKIFNNKLLIKSLFTMLIQGTSQLSAFIVAILLANHFTTFEYGKYIFGITCATMLAVFATLGADGILARGWGWSTLIGYERNKSVFKQHNWYWVRSNLIIFVVLFISFIFNYIFFSNSNLIEVFAFSFAIPFLSANLLQSFFIATKRVVFANFIQLGLRFIILISTVIFCFFVKIKPFELVVIMASVMTIYIFTIFITASLKYTFKSEKPNGNNTSFMLLKWGNLFLAQSDIILLKFFSSYSNVAYYAVGLQLSALVSFVINAINSNTIAQIAHDYKNCSHYEFQKRIFSYTKITVSLSGFILVCLLISGYWIVSLYGSAYVVSYYIFCILMFGQTVNVLCGSVFTILNMSGYEKITTKIFYQALAINIILGIILVNIFGMYGVAIASVVSMVYWNIILLVFVIKKLKINPTIFNSIK